MTYQGIKITNTTSPAAALNFITITNGKYDIQQMAAPASPANAATTMQSGSPVADVVLTSITIDTNANTISGYDASGTRYIVDKAGAVSLALASTT